MNSWIEKVLNFIKKNAECVFTLAGALIYTALGGIADAMGIGFAVSLTGIAFTALGVLSTMKSEKNRKDKRTALITHAAIWVLKGVLTWIAGVCAALWFINRYGSDRTPQIEQEPEKALTVSELPPWLYAPDGTPYGRTATDGRSAEYANRDNPDDKITITSVFSGSAGEVETNAGHFYMNG